MGSLIAAVASYAQARSLGGRWLLRMEDIDPPRERPGAAKAIEHDLIRFGLHSDKPTLYQSGRSAVYRQALQRLIDSGHAFACGCSRRHLGHGPIYPNTCSGGMPGDRTQRTWRIRTCGQFGFVDQVQGPFSQNLAVDVGAFIAWRADNLPAYQLAVVVDDEDQGITEVVRGCDLLDSTPRQIYLQRLLGLSTPRYLHLPVALNQQGSKLSKQTGARAIDPQQPIPALLAAWEFLGQSKPPKEACRSTQEFWCWAPARWSVRKVPTVSEIPINPV